MVLFNLPLCQPQFGQFPFYGAHFHISISDHPKLGSQMRSHKLSNIYVLSVELM
jgi:hypothetical protein